METGASVDPLPHPTPPVSFLLGFEPLVARPPGGRKLALYLLTDHAWLAADGQPARRQDDRR
jgi:hypothetical protein